MKIKKRGLVFCFFIIFLFFLFDTKIIKANQFPNDSITIPFNNTGLGEINLVATGTKTILQATIISYADSTSQGSYIDCGSVRIAKAYNKSWFDSRFMNYACDEEIVAGNSGTMGSYGQIVYVPYYFATTSIQMDKTINMNIENFDISATSSVVNGVATASASITSPFILFLFVYMVLALIFFMIFLYIKAREVL